MVKSEIEKIDTGIESLVDRHRSRIESLLQCRIIDSRDLFGGKNSRVYCLRDQEDGLFAAKFYHRSATDGRNRLDVEYRALAFMKENGLNAVPRVIARDDTINLGIYEFIPGSVPQADDVTQEDLEKLIDLLGRLKKMADQGLGDRFAPASEACFSVKEAVESIERRLERLQALEEKDLLDKELKVFLKGPFSDVFGRMAWRARDMAGRRFDEPIDASCRTLSPSDFGFHNSLRTGKEIVFIDFEYFGWDDPAKMVSDFLWHPAMDLERKQKTYFYQQMTGRWPRSSWLLERLRQVFPLFGLKWCMIILNEFVKTDFDRRQFAHGRLLNNEEKRRQQLALARHYLDRVEQYAKEFPF